MDGGSAQPYGCLRRMSPRASESTSLDVEKSCSFPCASPRRTCPPTLVQMLPLYRHSYHSVALGSTHGIAMSAVCARQLPRAVVRARCPRPGFRPAYTRLSQPSRNFSSSRRLLGQHQFHRKESFRSRLNSALKNTKVKWEPIPIALGIGFLGAFQLYRIQRREKHVQSEADRDDDAGDSSGKPRKRERIRPSGPW